MYIGSEKSIKKELTTTTTFNRYLSCSVVKPTKEAKSMAKNKVAVILDGSDVEVPTTKEGWDESKVQEAKILAAGWEVGQAPHYSLGFGLIDALINAEPQIEGLVLGKYNGVVVIDPEVLMDEMRTAICEKYSVEPTKFARVATHKANKEKVEIATAVANNLVALEALKESAPEVYAKIMAIASK